MTSWLGVKGDNDMLISQYRPRLLPSLLWGIACLTILSAIVGGLILTGGPHTGRMRRMDERRVQDLSQLKNAIENHFRIHQTLPNSIKDLKNVEDAITDPVSDKRYPYKRIKADSFQLCAIFELEDLTSEHSVEGFKNHKAGLDCFLFKKNVNRANNQAQSVFYSN
jgi:hypothetical protein